MRLPWPLPALLAWGLCWVLFALLQPRWGQGPALLAACLLGTLASLAGARWWRRVFIAAGFPLALLLSGAVALPAWAWLLALLALLAVYPLNAWRDAPLFPTPEGALQGLAAAAPLAAGARVLDAGCGLGHGLRALRAAYPQAQIEGLEWSWPLAGLCALRCPWARVRRGDIWAADWSAYQLVYVFQRPESMSRVRIKCGEMAPGSYLVSLEFALPDTPASAQTVGRDGRPLWIYRLPLAD
ncbi:class I SAM-dependent methyltransferase [Acidovorax sp. HDW3]|uniref:class I SAM-dependent methyltransferase n=1 Tax=Acidovorax sp. HDW3 TaxID=2714923 RepID=UPI001408B632|nr:class I SAM-dependent methyltransferase [Acidovorax sp. HDW3]QIL45309.1 class I SAM-dependent methyltransferase [Acidovorax sp. HDW3]